MSRKTVLPNEVWSDERLTLWQLKVLGALYSFKGKGGVVWPKKVTLAERAGVPVQHISRLTKELAALGWITKEGGGGRGAATRYTLHETCSRGEKTSKDCVPVSAAEKSKRYVLVSAGENSKDCVPVSAGEKSTDSGQKGARSPCSPIEQTKEQTTAPEGAAVAQRAAPAPAPACMREAAPPAAKPPAQGITGVTCGDCAAFGSSASIQAAPAPETGHADEPAFALQACEGKPITQRQARVRGTFVTMERPQEVGEQVWADWIAHRRNQKTPVAITATSMSYTYAEAKKAGISVEQALIYAMQFGWRNFTAAYFVNRVKGQIDAVAMVDKSPLESERDYRARKKMERVCPDMAARPPALSAEAAALALGAQALPALAAPGGDVVDVPVRAMSTEEFFSAEAKRIALEKRQAAEHEQGQ